MNDNSKRGPEWRRLLPEFFIPKYGGTVEQWQEANLSAAEKLWKNDITFNREDQEFEEFQKNKETSWVKDMFDSVGIEHPKGDLTQIYNDSASWVTQRVRSAFDGIIPIIRELAKKYQLFTASNEKSIELKGYLKGMEVAHLFDGFYGSDLIGDYKNSTYYYKELSRLSGIEPENGIVVDDKIQHLEYANQVGFHVIHSGLEGQEESKFPYFNKVDQLPEHINNIVADTKYNED